jgi:UDP-glucose 4-epimerase
MGQRFIAWVYSDVDARTVDEDSLLPAPAHVYTASKLSGELFCHSYAELYGLRPIVLRFGVPYGPRARPAAVIPSFVERALRSEPISIAGSGEQERSFVYVEDLAEGVVCALADPAAGGTYNLAGRETTTIRELADLVADEVAPTEIVHVDGRAGDLRGATVSSDRAERQLGWRASTPLREGIRRYAEWLGEQSASAPAPAPARAAPTVHGVLARLAAVTHDPAYAGAAAVIAVLSAAVSAIVGSGEDSRAAFFAIVALALIVPLVSLTIASWPPDRRRLQAMFAALGETLSVGLFGLLSADSDLAGIRPTQAMTLIFASVGITTALRMVPKRPADDSR